MARQLVRDAALIHSPEFVQYVYPTFVATGSTAVGSTSLSIPYTTNPAAGTGLVLTVINKYPNNFPTTPTGYTLVKRATGGAGSSGADSGNVAVSVYTKEADGTETGNVAVTITGGNSSLGRILQYSKPAGKTWSFAGAIGSDNTAGGEVTYTYDADPGFRAGDLALVVRGFNSDVASSQLGVYLHIPGCITGPRNGASRISGTTTQGDDCRHGGTEYNVIYGESVGAGYYSSLDDMPSASASAGASVLLRIRAV